LLSANRKVTSKRSISNGSLETARKGGAHVLERLGDDRGAVRVVLVDLLVDLARPPRIGFGHVHDGQHRGEREHGEAPRGDEAHDDPAEEEDEIREERGERVLQRLDHRAHVARQPLHQVAGSEAIEEGDILHDDASEELAADPDHDLATDDHERERLEPAQDAEHNRERQVVRHRLAEALPRFVTGGRRVGRPVREGGGRVGGARGTRGDDVVEDAALQVR